MHELQYNLYQNTNIFIEENVLENAVKCQVFCLSFNALLK